MVMYGVYNAETFKKHQMYPPPNEKLFAGELNTAYVWYVNKQGIQHYAINLLLYLRILKKNT